MNLDTEQARLKREMDARKERHPFPGGWREGPTERELEAWREVVAKYRNWKPRNPDWPGASWRWKGNPPQEFPNFSVAGLSLGEVLAPMPDGRMDDFDIKTYEVKVTWPIPAPVNVVSPPFRTVKAPKHIFIDGVEYARPVALRDVFKHSEQALYAYLRRHRARITKLTVAGRSYYRISEFVAARIYPVKHIHT